MEIVVAIAGTLFGGFWLHHRSRSMARLLMSQRERGYRCRLA